MARHTNASSKTFRDREALESALDGVEFVYHLGAVKAGTSEEEFSDTNVTGTRNLLEAVANRRSDGFRRLLFISSQAAAGPSPDGRPIDESHPLRPVSWYGKSKRDAEAVVNRFSDTLPVTIVRPVKVYGEGEQGISRRTFPMVRAGLAPRLGIASKMVSLVYVGDVVEGMIAAAESPQSLGKTYFLSDPNPYKQREVFEAIADAMGKRLLLPVIVPHLVLVIVALFVEWTHQFTGGRPVLTRDKVRELRQRWWTATPAAAANDLGWSSQVSLRDGMARAVADWDGRRREAKWGKIDLGKQPGRCRASIEQHDEPIRVLERHAADLLSVRGTPFCQYPPVIT